MIISTFTVSDLEYSTFGGSDVEDPKNSYDYRPAPATNTATATTTIDGELILLFRSLYRVNGMYRMVDTILSSTELLLLQSGLMHTDGDDDDTINNNDSTVLHVDDRYKYSTTTIDGELIMLFRLAYRVDKILSSIVLLLRSQPVHEDDTIAVKKLIVLYQDGHSKNDTFASMQIAVIYQDVHDDDDTVAITRPVLYQIDNDIPGLVPCIMNDDNDMQLVLHQDKYILPSLVPSLVYCSSTTIDGEFDDDDNNDDDDCYDNNINILHEDGLISSTTTIRRPLSSTVPSLVSGYSTTTIDGELILVFQLAYRVDMILLFRSAYRVDRMHRVHKDDYTSANMQIVVLFHDDDDSIDIMQLARNNYSYRMKLTPTTEDSSSTENRADSNRAMTNEDMIKDPNYSNDITTTRSTNQLWVKNINYNNIRCNGCDDYHNNRMRTNGERTTCYSNQDVAIDASLRVGNFNDDKAKSKFNPSYNNINSNNYWYNNNNDNNNNVIFGIVIMTYYAGSLLFGNKTTTLISNIQDGMEVKEERLGDKFQLRALRSEGQYKDEVYNAEEGMFQEPILWLDYYLVIIFMYSFSRTSNGDGDETTTLINTNQNGENKKIEEMEERSKEPVPSFLMIRICLCLCSSIVTLNRKVHNVLGQSMGSVKIHKDQMNQVSQTRARLESTFGSTFGMRLRTLESCIQSDVFVCSSLLKRMFFPT